MAELPENVGPACGVWRKKIVWSCATSIMLVSAVSAIQTEPSTAAARYTAWDQCLKALHTSRAAVQETWTQLTEDVGSTVDNLPRRWKVLAVVGLTGALTTLWWHRTQRRRRGKPARSLDGPRSKDAKSSPISTPGRGSTPDIDEEPLLLQKYSSFRSFTMPIHNVTYPNVRVFYSPHPQANKLPSKPTPLPLLVFLHGVGGTVAQYHPLLTSFVNAAPCLAIDFPGCGLSDFAPTSWEAYTTDALVELCNTIIEDYRDKDARQDCVLIGHSYGATIAAALGSRSSPYATTIAKHTIGLIAICPAVPEFKPSEARMLSMITSLPNFLLDLWRWNDQRGGYESESLKRVTGPKADLVTRKRQHKFNQGSKTAVFKRTVHGLVPRLDKHGKRLSGASSEIWAGLQVPLYLVAGEDDQLTPPEIIDKLIDYCGYKQSTPSNSRNSNEHSFDSVSIPNVTSPALEQCRNGSEIPDDLSLGAAALGQKEADDIPRFPSYPKVLDEHRRWIRKALKTTVLPSPAGHALIYAPGSARTLAGLISDFMSVHIDPRLSLGWQLQYLSTEGKWDVKNFAKWQAVNPVSEPIGGIFRAMKTLREVDGRHSPKLFVEAWKSQIGDVIDISHGSPVYDPRGLEKGGIIYHKLPTASKVVPSETEVEPFIELVDHLLASRTDKSLSEQDRDRRLVGVHCHYGFNRTGYFIVCYLMERCGYTLEKAIEEFAKQRPPGIRHEHFVDALYVRYCIGLKRAPTM